MSSLRALAARVADRLRRPRTTVRWRLTLLYGAVFLASGAVLLTVTYVLVAHAPVTTPHQAFVGRPPPNRGLTATRNALTLGWQADLSLSNKVQRGQQHPVTPGAINTQLKRLLKSGTGRATIAFVNSSQRVSDLHELVIESAIALAIMALISTALGWVVAGRVLAPIRTMTATTREISAASLDQRLALDGPPDELHELGDTIDGLLERLQTSFEAQRRFVANASHELRTPLTAARALLEMVLSDPDAGADTFRETCEQVLEEEEQQEQLINALLALAQGERGLDRHEPVDLATVTREIVDALEGEATAHGVQLHASIHPAVLSGEERLVGRLVANLVQNAIRHNLDGGRVDVGVSTVGGQPSLTVANTGPVVPEDQIERLLRPFQRMAADRVGYREGLGLGLSIVAAIAHAHDAALTVHASASGGLEIAVRFPRAGHQIVIPERTPAPATDPVRV